jgi:hypothetical protein
MRKSMRHAHRPTTATTFGPGATPGAVRRPRRNGALYAECRARRPPIRGRTPRRNRHADGPRDRASRHQPEPPRRGTKIASQCTDGTGQREHEVSRRSGSFASAVLLGAALCGGCATTPYRPLVDSGVSRGDYESDLADCRELASQRPAAATAVGGATIGAVFGALLGVAVGLRGEDVRHLAAWGAASGGINGAAYGTAEQQAIVARCMAGRGYNVLAP